MHVALLSPAWPHAAYPNGIVTYVHFLRQALLARGHSVSVFTRTIGPGQTDSCVYRIAPSAAERVFGTLKRRLLGQQTSVFDAGRMILPAIKRVHARDRIDVIEMEESFGHAADVASLGIPLVVKLHGPAFLTMVAEELKTPFGEEKMLREGEALRKLPVITSPSRWTLSETISRYGLSPAVAEQVLNPIESCDDGALWDLAKCDRKTVLFVGRFDKIKGGDLMIRAFQCLLPDKPELKLIFVGPDVGLVQMTGGHLHLHQFVASLNDPVLERNVSYRGRLDTGDVNALRQTALVTVIASRQESQGYTALEAMVQACPVVCTDTSGLSEIVAHGVNGLKARADDAQDLAAQIKRILDDPQLGRALGLAARDYVLKNHSPTTVVEQTLDVYCRAISLHRARSSARR